MNYFLRNIEHFLYNPNSIIKVINNTAKYNFLSMLITIFPFRKKAP